MSDVNTGINTKELHPEIWKLFDRYVHGLIDRRGFLDGAAKYTGNVGLQYRHALTAAGLAGVFRADYERIGPTYWYPDNFTKRDPVNLLNLRAGVGGDAWTLTAWSRNLTDEDYNAEWSPGPQFFPNPGYANNFVFKAQPMVWGIDFQYRF